MQYNFKEYNLLIWDLISVVKGLQPLDHFQSQYPLWQWSWILLQVCKTYNYVHHLQSHLICIPIQILIWGYFMKDSSINFIFFLSEIWLCRSTHTNLCLHKNNKYTIKPYIKRISLPYFILYFNILKNIYKHTL